MCIDFFSSERNKKMHESDYVGQNKFYYVYSLLVLFSFGRKIIEKLFIYKIFIPKAGTIPILAYFATMPNVLFFFLIFVVQNGKNKRFDYCSEEN